MMLFLKFVMISFSVSDVLLIVEYGLLAHNISWKLPFPLITFSGDLPSLLYGSSFDLEQFFNRETATQSTFGIRATFQ